MKKKSYEQMVAGWFSVMPTLSYGRRLNIITGKRSTGKSTGVAIFLLTQFLTFGYGWIYTRRTDKELQKSDYNWFDNACTILNKNGWKVEVKKDGDKFYVNGEMAGWSIPLSGAQKYKGSNLSPAKYIVFDEFISDNGVYNGAAADFTKEYKQLRSIWTTCDREIGKSHKDTTIVFCLGNGTSWYNPVYIALDIGKYIRVDTHFLAPKSEAYVVQQMTAEDSPMGEDYKNTETYKLATAEEKAELFENKAKETAFNAFIKKIEKPMDWLCNIIFDGKKYGVKYDRCDCIMYICKHPGEGVKTYALTAEDHKPNYFLAVKHRPYELDVLLELYEMGNIYFEDYTIKRSIDSFYLLTKH